MPMFNDTDLFESGPLKIKRFNIRDAGLTLYEYFFSKGDADQYYRILQADTSWKQETITIYDKTMLSPRLTCWYRKQRTAKPPLPWTATLMAIKKVEEAAQIGFISVLLNYYRDGRDSVAWHRDHDKNLY